MTREANSKKKRIASQRRLKHSNSACSTSRKALRISRIAIVIFCAFVARVSLNAQNSTQDENSVPVKPSVSKPAKPSVSKPTLGSGFYMPKRSDFYMGVQSSAQKQSQTATTQKTEQPADSESTQSSHSSAVTTNAQNLDASALNSIATTGAQSLNMLTADDISSMNNLGILSSLSGLMGRGQSNLQSQLLSQNTVTASTVDSATLKQILSELTELKKQINVDSSVHKKDESSIALSDKSAGKDGFSNKSTKEPKILRFVVNGYDMLPTCTKVYFSDFEADGTFLLTGDRKYLSENKVRSETFYFYFHARENKNGITTYMVTPAVSQDYENQYSYLYQLTQKSEMSAERTGNLMTVRASEADWKLDMLLSLDK